MKGERMTNKKYYTAEEIEKGLMQGIDKGIFTKQLIQNLRASRKLSYTKIGGKTYYTEDDIEEYIAKNRVKSA